MKLFILEKRDGMKGKKKREEREKKQRRKSLYQWDLRYYYWHRTVTRERALPPRSRSSRPNSRTQTIGGARSRLLEVSLSAKDVLERVGEPRASVEVTFLGTKSSFNLSFPSEQTTTIKRTSPSSLRLIIFTNYFINVIKWWKYIYGFFLIIHRTGYREISNFRR